MSARTVRLEALEAVLWLIGAPGHPPPAEATDRTFYTDLTLELEQAIAGAGPPLRDPVAEAADDAVELAVLVVDAWRALDDAGGLEHPTKALVELGGALARLEAATDYRRRT